MMRGSKNSVDRKRNPKSDTEISIQYAYAVFARFLKYLTHHVALWLSNVLSDEQTSQLPLEIVRKFPLRNKLCAFDKDKY